MNDWSNENTSKIESWVKYSFRSEKSTLFTVLKNIIINYNARDVLSNVFEAFMFSLPIYRAQ